MNEIQETPQEQTPAETGSTQYFSPVEEAPQEQEVQNQETEVVEPVEEPTQESVESTDDEYMDRKIQASSNLRNNAKTTKKYKVYDHRT